MKQVYCVICNLILLLILSACTNSTADQPLFNDYVAEYTTGVHSRDTEIELVLNDPLPAEFQKPDYLKTAFSISPKVAGKLEVIDDNRLLFQPSVLLQSGKEYTVTWDLSKFFKTDKKNKDFTFSFRTIDPDVSFRLSEMDIYLRTATDTLYEFKGSVMLSDWADSATVHKLVDFDAPVEVMWEKVGIAKSFDLTFRTRHPFDEAKDIRIFSKWNRAGYPRKTLSKVRIPGKNDFDVYSIRPVTEGDEYVEVTFTRLLNPDQDFSGLVEVDPAKGISFSVEENKLKIWMQTNVLDTRDITIHDGIRSLYGNRRLVTNKEERGRYEKRISFRNNYPSLQFIGNGGIVPPESTMNIPFAATNLRGVIVRVVKVYENNMGQFLQNNSLSDGYGLAALGELLCRKIIFLDERGNIDIHTRNTFAINLKELISPEPGALYRVFLSYNYELTAFPCAGIQKMTKRELIEQNKQLEAEEKANFGNGNAYYYFSDQSWRGYNWEERDMPCKPSYYLDRLISKNILQSDLGIIAKKGDRGKMFVSVNSIVSGEPEGDVSVGVYTYQNQEIAMKTTWENGTTEIDLKGKEPYYLIARKGSQRGYLRLAKEEALSMSSFDVAGEEVKNGTKGFIYTERGIWRPGDTLFVSFILNNMYDELPERHPVTFELFNPAGQLYWRKSLSTRKDNFYVFKPVTSVDAPTGLWSGKVTVGGVSFEKKLRIETIKPNRLSIDLTFDNKILQRDTLTKATLKAQWLTGATAESLNYDIYTSFVPMETSFEGWKGYVFDDPTRKFTANDILFSKGKLNKRGTIDIDTRMTQGGFAPGFLRAQFLTKVYEESGDFSVNAIQKVYSPFKSYVGILSPQKEDTPLETGKAHKFDFATVRPNGTPAKTQRVKVKVFKTEWYWWWDSDVSEVANFISSGYHKPIREYVGFSNGAGKGAVTMNIPNSEWGTYYIQLTDMESGHQSGCMAYFDMYGSDIRDRRGSDRATLLNLQANKEEYAPGEQIKVSFPSTSESRAIITVEASGGILQHYEVDCEDKQTTFAFEATEEMQPNVYVSVMLLNPYASTKYDLPIRLYGVMPINVNAPNSRLQPVIEAPESVRPGSMCKVTVAEKRGYPMTFTLGVVDEGLLELTNFKTPSPWEAFFAKEALGMRTWDMYREVLGAYGGKIEQIFSIGGDDALNKGPKAIVNRFKPVVRFMGPYTLKSGEKRTLDINIPEYIGKVRCMVIAGNNHQFGNAQKDIFVRQPLMVLGTLPRKLAPGDEIWVPATVFAMKENLGKVNVRLEVNEAFTILEKASREIAFEKEGNQVVWFRIKAKEQLEKGMVRINAVANGEKATWSSDIEIYSPLNTVSESENVVLKAGESKSFDFIPFGIEGSNSGVLSIASIKLLNLNNRFEYMINYPYECLEQIISKSLVATYLPEVCQFSPAEQARMEDIVRSVNSKIKNYMVPGGGFSHWPGQTSTNAWNSIYAFIYLNEMANSGFILSHGLRHECGQYEARIAREWKPVESPYSELEKVTQAFRLYALAQARIPEKGAMNRLRQLNGLPVEAKWLLAGAYAFENKEIGRQILESIGNTGEATESIYNSMLFAKSIELMAYMSVGYNKQAETLMTDISKVLESTRECNTAELAFALIGVSNFYRLFPPAQSLEFDWNVNGKLESIKSKKAFWEYKFADLDRSGKVQVTNTSKGTLFVQKVISGIQPKGKQVATSNGIALQTSFKTLEGKPVQIKELAQGTNFVFEMKVTNKSGLRMEQLMVEQLIPAGWEIINKRIFNNGSQYPAGVNYQNYRDDKVVSLINVLPPQASVTIPILVTAAYAGNFYMPASTCKGMYRLTDNASTAGMEVVVRRD